MLELLPLQPPRDGWAANWIFWIRVAAISYVLAFVGVSVLRRFVLGLQFTFGKLMIVAAGISVGFTGFTVGFPVPFVMLVGGAPDVLVIGVMVVLVFGIAPFRSTSPSVLSS
ncbi:hypothetical protein JG687_00012595 [Phytophthora cactorum]|uniref:Uncharacterized protein n=1 Tax=Phytophthora cactorum TaxID=29920 RepID=A0A8T1U1F3_9STRA|nr:hypothetical protein JG687_00012595 [Phytophthora cactorum]